MGKQLLPLVIGSGLVQHLRHLVTSEYEPWERLPRSLVIGVNVWTAQRRFNGWAFLVPLLQRNALIAELPYRDARIVLVAALAE